MSEALSIYPITQLYFECSGCKTRWMLRADPPIMSVEDFQAFTSNPDKMESCPRNCGASTCSIAFRLPAKPTDSPLVVMDDPLSIFDAFKEKP